MAELGAKCRKEIGWVWCQKQAGLFARQDQLTCIVTSEKKSKEANLLPSVTVLVGILGRTKSVLVTKARKAICIHQSIRHLKTGKSKTTF